MNGAIGITTIKKQTTGALVVLAVILWALSIAFGLTKLYNYDFKPGIEGRLSAHWPTASVIKPQKNIFNLIMVAHPHCPCSRASMGELEIIMAHNQGKVNVYVLFFRPNKFNETWVKTDLYYQARRIPGVHVIIDDEGRQANLFGGTTSGETFLYDTNGNLVFTGGITESRGHAGDNIGRDTIDDLINRRQVKVHKTKFFGCSIMDSMRKAKNQEGDGYVSHGA